METETRSLYLTRQSHLVQALQSAGLDGLVLNPGPTLTYLTGLHFHLMERPVTALFFTDGRPYLVLPELEIAKVSRLPFTLETCTFDDNPETWHIAFEKIAQESHLNGKRIGVEPGGLRFLELRFLENAAPKAQFVSAQDVVASLRMRKDPTEIELMQKAVEIAQNAFKAVLPLIKKGVSEREISSELTLQSLKAGSDAEFPFMPIVSTGPNSANPHAVPTDRKLAEGDLLVIDWGASYGGYISDLTRTLAIGKIDPEFERIAQLVLEANANARSIARPGIPAGDVDRAARSVIESAGYGPEFRHRVGHGIGMEGHEEPYMFGENKLILQPGMAFTVEPGIYLLDRGGVRIEDDVIITADGAKTLSNLPRELIHVS